MTEPIEDIIKKAKVVMDAVIVGENTATRVGGTMVLIAEKLKEKVDALEIELQSKFDKSDVVQSTGNGMDKVMSQDAVTRELNKLIEMISTTIIPTGFQMSMQSSEGWNFSFSMLNKLDADGNYLPFTVLSVVGWWFGQVVTDKMFNVRWTRDTGFQDDDAAWNKQHSNMINNIPITYNDIGASSYRIGNVKFTCTAEFVSDSGRYLVTKSINL